MHDSTTYLINENGDNEMPQEAKILTAALPADLAARSLSGKDYAGKTIKFRFENDWIMGLPKMCYDRDTRRIKEPIVMGQGQGGVVESSCTDWENYDHASPDSNTWWEELGDILLPAGTTVTEENIFTGVKTNFVLKAKGMAQIIPLSSDQGACDAIPNVTPQQLANFRNHIKMEGKPPVMIGNKPTLEEAPLKVTVDGILPAYQLTDTAPSPSM